MLPPIQEQCLHESMHSLYQKFEQSNEQAEPLIQVAEDNEAVVEKVRKKETKYLARKISTESKAASCLVIAGIFFCTWSVYSFFTTRYSASNYLLGAVGIGAIAGGMAISQLARKKIAPQYADEGTQTPYQRI
jgi:uncharacterized membrane protein